MSKVQDLYSQLNKKIQSEEFEQAISICDQILKNNEKEEEAIQCKIVSMIYLSKFKECVEFFEKNEKIQNQMKFLYVYCLYKENLIEKGLEILEKEKDLTNDLLHLQAQMLYKSGLFQKARDIYFLLIDKRDDNSPETLTNLAACEATLLLENSNQVKEILSEKFVKEKQVFELFYNLSYLKLFRGDLVGSLELLEFSEKLCKDLDDDITLDLAQINTQKGYLFQIQNKFNQAEKFYNLSLQNKTEKSLMHTLASNNLAVIKSDQEIFTSLKKTKDIEDKEIQQKLLPKQKEFMKFNRCLILLFMNKLEKFEEGIQDLQKEFPQSDLIPLLFAALKTHQNKLNESLEILQNHKNQTLSIRLTQVHLHILKRNLKKAFEILTSIQEIQNFPATFSILLSILHQMKDDSSAKDLIQKTIHYYHNLIADLIQNYKNQENSNEKQKENENENSNENEKEKEIKQISTTQVFPTNLEQKDVKIIREYFKKILNVSGNFLLKIGNTSQAVKIFEQLIQFDPDDLVVISHLISAAAETEDFDFKQFHKYIPIFEKQLPELTKDFDVQKLVNLPTPDLSVLKEKLQTMKNQQENAAKEAKMNKPKKGRKRGKRLPKNYDPNTTPDPERWLPKYQRSSFRKQRKKKESRETQGLIPTEEITKPVVESRFRNPKNRPRKPQRKKYTKRK
ncbi:signal recognition particle 72 [Anaeramoeba ignava]|uniref:Signal recognition particle subunit SRP72 n=1 Tax=Anaeramoeba ignava TaxID=1746090 RepID=A0A9Q0LHV0_ANAIG|nr:signal recognition particle 72 [Anaeramoeba ignava]